MANMAATGTITDTYYEQSVGAAAYTSPVKFIYDQLESLRKAVRLAQRRLEMTDIGARDANVGKMTHEELIDWLKTKAASNVTIDSIKEACTAEVQRLEALNGDEKAKFNRWSEEIYAAFKQEAEQKKNMYSLELDSKTAYMKLEVMKEKSSNAEQIAAEKEANRLLLVKLNDQKFRNIATNSGISLPFPTKNGGSMRYHQPMDTSA